ncbi:MAG: metal-dependent hydrolase [Pseudomonadota bacterium]
MDNISHSLVGLALGELVQRTLPPEADAAAPALRRRMLLASCWAASNLPDLDLVLGGLLPAPLGNLLHHRGHTHILALAPAQALLLMALVWLFWPSARRLLHDSRNARAGLLAVTCLGFLMHIGFDYLNSYGVHPFYPIAGRWLYGDILFIVEPVIWLVLGVPLALMVATRWLRFALLALLAGVLAWSTARGFLHPVSLLVLVLSGAVFAWLQNGADAKRVLGAGFLALSAFIGVQWFASSLGKQLVAAELHQRDPDSLLLDTAMTAFPANPLCWEFVSVERNDRLGIYRLRRGQLSLAPGLLPVAACPAGLSEPMVAASPAFGIAWEEEASLTRLRARASNCHFHAWLRFARAPALGSTDAGDARYSMGGSNFTTFTFARFAGQPCAGGVPGWDLPRQDLLSP